MEIAKELKINEKTGLTKDALNPLSVKITLLYSIVDLKGNQYLDYIMKIKNRVKNDLPTYEQYFKFKYPNEAEEIINHTKEDFLSKYNKKVIEYNNIDKSERLNIEFNESYYNALLKIIIGL